MSVSGAGARRKGSAFEREIRQQIRAIGIECKRVPLSGAAQGFKGDLQLAGMTAECKRRKRSYSSLYQALEQGGGSDLLFVRDDQRDSLVVMPFDTFASLCRWAGLPQKYPATTSEETTDV